MSDQSLTTPSTPTPPSSQELLDKLHAVVAIIDDCKWTANALHLSASSIHGSEPRETNWRMKGVSRVLFTTLGKASNDILALIEILARRKEPES